MGMMYSPLASFHEVRAVCMGRAPATPADEWMADTAGETDAGGYGRLSAAIHNSGDPFTKGWHNPPDHLDPDLTGRGWIINFFELMAEAGLIPRPERQTTITSSRLRFAAAFIAKAIACEDSMAGRIPSVRAIVRKASNASVSVALT